MIHKNLLYKYMGFDGDRPRTSFLENESFRFTQRSLLNDPFETLPVIYPPNQESVRNACKKLHPPTHVRVVNNGLMSNGTGGAFISMRY